MNRPWRALVAVTVAAALAAPPNVYALGPLEKNPPAVQRVPR